MYFVYSLAFILFLLSWTVSFVIATGARICGDSRDSQGMALYLTLGAIYSLILWQPVASERINLDRLCYALFMWIIYVLLAILMLFRKQWWPFPKKSLCLSDQHHMGLISISSMGGMAILHSLVVLVMWVRKNRIKHQIQPIDLQPFLEERVL